VSKISGLRKHSSALNRAYLSACAKERDVSGGRGTTSLEFDQSATELLGKYI
jgi:hypothetical protein